MKTKYLILTCLLVGLALTFDSCKKKGCTDPTANNYNEKAKKDDGSCTYDPPTNNNQNFTNYCTYTADGTPATSSSFYLSSFSGIEMCQSYVGSVGTFPNMTIKFAQSVAVGSYTNDGQFGNNHGFSYQSTSASTDQYFGDGSTGTITITNHDLTNTIIEGTFSGTIYNSSGGSIVITNGAFGYDY